MHNAPVSAPPNTFQLETTGRILRIQVLTLVWMRVEALVSLGWFERAPEMFLGASAVDAGLMHQIASREPRPCTVAVYL